MKNYKILSKAILAICLFGIILTIINSFTGFINSSISTSGTIICISSFIVAGVAIMLLENRRFKSNIRETWRVILVSEADIFLSESLRILAECLSQSEIGLPLRQICYYSPPEEVGVFSTEINRLR